MTNQHFDDLGVTSWCCYHHRCPIALANTNHHNKNQVSYIYIIKCMITISCISLKTWECTAQGMLESRKMTKQTDWLAKQLSQAACVLEDLKCKCWGASDIVGTKSSISHHLLLGGERRSKRKCLKIFLERAILPTETYWINWKWNCFKGNTRATSERQDGACMGFPECTDTILNCTELSQYLLSVSEVVSTAATVLVLVFILTY